jgi:hypothetical protein
MKIDVLSGEKTVIFESLTMLAFTIIKIKYLQLQIQPLSKS